MNCSKLKYKASQLLRKAVMTLVLPGVVVLPAQAQPGAAPQNANSAQATRVIDSIAAVVNSEIITTQELEEGMKQLEQRLRYQGANIPPPAEFRRQLLEEMIMDRVQLQRAKELGIRVDDMSLDRALARIAEQNKLSMQQLRDQVEREGTPYPRFREEIREEITLQRLREREVANRIRISETEVDNYLAANEAALQGKQELHLAQILIKVPENASPETVARLQQRAGQVLQQLQSGAAFEKLAASQSDAVGQEADFGWRSADRLPQAFVEAVAGLEPGQVSRILRSRNGFHILKLVGKRNAGMPAVPAVQQTRVRHILIKVNQVVSAEEAHRRLLELKQRLDNNAAKFEDLARLHSNDLSASAGGDLGWIYPGDTVPEFERAMNALQPGEVSEPVQSPFGYHLIQVVERKVEDMPEERLRLAARQALHQRKMQEATEEWLRQLRDQAYVEYRLGPNRNH